MTSEQSRSQEREDRVSLAGPDPLDVLWALLKVDPDAPPAGQSPDETRSASPSSSRTPDS